jgi:hypothetical protein
MKRIAISLLFALLFALGMAGHAVTVQQVDEGDHLAVNWNSRVKK